ncbi:MAG: PHP domain-containing protein [Alphaproteobacteria bacterium]|nr:PHP domain-containing protein [Alphaproteobacteria bacterium]
MSTLTGRRRFDLHLHTTRSDGMLEPEALVAACAEGGLDVIAITDHDLAADQVVGEQVVGDRSILVLAGAEISGVHEGVEHHLLVYFGGPVPDAFRAFCRERCRERAARYAEATVNLGLTGLPDVDDAARQGGRAITRHHLARALVAAGHAADLRDAFRRYAGDSLGNVPKVTLPFVEAIRIAREAGAVTSWAHPPVAALEKHLATFVAAGLQGVEGLRPMMTSAERRKVRKLAEAHGVFLTGGSDWHGWSPSRPGLFHVERSDLSGFLDALATAA